MSKRPFSYYLRRVPGLTNIFYFDSFDAALESYKDWKNKIADCYIANEELKRDCPEIYDMLINADMNDEEIKKLKEEYQKEKVII